ncbi:MAG: SDR family oxidoreductase [Nocardioidaceae bacterium]
MTHDQIPLHRLDGKVAIVTGARGGLGRALCARLEQEGAQVLPVDLVGDNCFIADIGTREGNQAVVAEALSRFGRIDVLVLNAGVQHTATIDQMPEEQWDRLNDVLVKGPFLTMQAAWGALADVGGRVVVISSTSAIHAEHRKTAYCAAKAGVLGLVRSAALDGAERGIAVNAVAPGWMRTELSEGLLHAMMEREELDEQAALDKMLDRHPTKRFVETAEVASAVSFLASSDASAINGVCLPVDLGLLAW